jgi:hypothetical protein
MNPNTETDRSQSAPHDRLAQPDRADLAQDDRARAGLTRHPVLFVLIGAVVLFGLLLGGSLLWNGSQRPQVSSQAVPSTAPSSSNAWKTPPTPAGPTTTGSGR